MTIVDSFIFFNEVDLLRLRLLSQIAVCDAIVIAESTHTFTGVARTPVVEELLNCDPRFAFVHKHKKKIYVVVYAPESLSTDPWEHEKAQRNYLSDHVREIVSPRAVVFGSDIDEIPAPATMRMAAKFLEENPSELVAPSFWMCMYHPNYVKIWGPETESRGPVFYVPSYQAEGLERLRARAKIKAFDEPDPVFQLSGWHLSYMGGARLIREKLKAFSHQEERVQRASHDVSMHIRAGSAPFDSLEDVVCAALSVSELGFPNEWLSDGWFQANLLTKTSEAATLPKAIVRLNAHRKAAKKRKSWLRRLMT